MEEDGHAIDVNVIDGLAMIYLRNREVTPSKWERRVFEVAGGAVEAAIGLYEDVPAAWEMADAIRRAIDPREPAFPSAA